MKHAILTGSVFLLYGCSDRKADAVSQIKNDIQPKQERFTPDNAGLVLVGLGYNLWRANTSFIEALLIDPVGRKTATIPPQRPWFMKYRVRYMRRTTQLELTAKKMFLHQNSRRHTQRWRSRSQ